MKTLLNSFMRLNENYLYVCKNVPNILSYNKQIGLRLESSSIAHICLNIKLSNNWSPYMPFIIVLLRSVLIKIWSVNLIGQRKWRLASVTKIGTTNQLTNCDHLTYSFISIASPQTKPKKKKE